MPATAEDFRSRRRRPANGVEIVRNKVNLLFFVPDFNASDVSGSRVIIVWVPEVDASYPAGECYLSLARTTRILGFWLPLSLLFVRGVDTETYVSLSGDVQKTQYLVS
jgi:hypothetical protein